MRTRVGYAGGATPHPTYHDLGDHTETVEVDFDPAVITYEQLLEVFWRSHDPTSRAWSRQYMAAVFCHGEAQHAAADTSKARVEAALGRPVRTPLLPAGPFHRAEGYHQKYRLKADRVLMAELARYYRDEDALTDSTVAARLNGYLSGCGDETRLARDLPRFGLSHAGERRLAEVVAR